MGKAINAGRRVLMIGLIGRDHIDSAAHFFEETQDIGWMVFAGDEKYCMGG